MTRISTSMTIENEHIAALDAERDKYTSRSDLLNQILDKHYAVKEEKKAVEYPRYGEDIP
jgi:hypothetical protein